MNVLRLHRLQALFALSVFAGVGSWLVFGRQPPTLRDGMASVAVADSAEVDRIESALIRSGRADEAKVLRGAWLTRLGRYQDVLNLLPRDLALGPLRRDVLRLVGECLFRLGDLQQAEVALTQLVADFPDEVEAYRLLGVMYYDLGSYELALVALDKVRVLDPVDFRPHHVAGVILSDKEQFLEAIEQFRLALQKQPPRQTQSVIRREIAKAMMRVHQYQEAVQTLDADEPSADRSALLAECFRCLGDSEKARSLIDTVLKSDSEHLPSLRVKARLLEDDEKLDDAILVLRQILTVERFDVESRYRLVQLLGARGLLTQRDAEQSDYLRYRSLQDRLVKTNAEASANPDHVELRQELAQICRELGRTELADMWQRAAETCEKRRLLRSAFSTSVQGKPSKP